jgi:hypothetical protein
MKFPAGIKAGFLDGKLKLYGLQAMPQEDREEVIRWARDNKQAIIENLLRELLYEVGAVIRRDPDGQVLVFNPPLAGPDYDPKRWNAAQRLQELFLTSQQDKGGTYKYEKEGK